MRRTLIAIVLVTTVSLLFAFVGTWMVKLLFWRNGDDWITVSVIDAFLLFPLMSLTVGVLAAWMYRWWLAGLCLVPLLGYWLWGANGDRFAVWMCVIYLAISLASGFATMRIRLMSRQSISPPTKSD
jgi:hypothetical protein